MGNAFYRHDYKLSAEEMKDVKRLTGFTNTQVNRLFRRFHHLDKEGKGYLTKDDLMTVKEIVLNPLGERIVEMFFPHCQTPEEMDEARCSFEEFARAFAVFRPVKNSTPTYGVNSREAKMAFLFNLIDLQRDGQVSKDELHDLLEQMMGAKVGEEQLAQIAERVVSEADSTGDGTMTYAEFKEATKDIDVETRMSFISFS